MMGFLGMGTDRSRRRADPIEWPESAPSTEDALALEFTRRHGGDWRYVAKWNQWLVWNGQQWVREDTLKVFDLARDVCREAAEGAKKSVKTRLLASKTVAAVEHLARADRAHAATTEAWDRDLWLLNTPGGIVDLRTGELGDHDRALAMTKITTATPSDQACPRWLEFLATITNGDAELQSYLQRVVGYCLTGITAEEAFFFAYGKGANGKSVFINTISTILGDYATTAPVDMLMMQKGERHPTDMAGLRGARLVAATETEEGRRWAEAKLKTLTGGDPISARFMRGDFFEYLPQFKLFVSGNHKPSIRSVDEAIRRRLQLSPFTVTIAPAKRDKKLPEKLLAERDGILAWAVEGCLQWRSMGLAPPKAVVSATEEYFSNEDALANWIEETCEIGKLYSETVTLLFEKWKEWAEASGEYPGTKKAFSQNLISRGFEPWRTSVARGFRGLRFKSGSAMTAELELQNRWS